MAITIPYTFTTNTSISSTQVNANFTALLNALDKRGDTLTGNLTVDPAVTIDGVDISAVIGTGGTLLAVNGAAVTALNATQLTSGTVPDARFPSTLPALNGSALTALNGSNIASGTVADARLPTTMAAKTLTTPHFTNYTETKTAPSISGNALTLDMANGNHFVTSLNANITTLTISNAPTTGLAWALVLVLTFPDSTTRTVTWPASVKWDGGTAPTLTCSNGKWDIFVLYSYDGGTTYSGNIVGQAYA